MKVSWRDFTKRSTTVVLVLCIIYFPTTDTCGYSSCPKTKPGFINIHLVAHSHDDVGWLKTVDQYYYGSNMHIQKAAVQYTLDSVVQELQKNPNRRFIYVESAFFWRWWRNQDEETQQVVRKLVQNGQLEFISGGWAMADEASTHYNALIDQMTLGLRYLNDTFGECAVPKAGWQIDPFGHAREQASLFAQMGFDGLFIGRLDYQEKGQRRWKHEMEMLWDASPNNLEKESRLFTGILYNYYMPPDGFCFDITCDDDPINDDPRLADYNVEEKVRRFISIAKSWARPYDTGHVIMTMGSDFHYMAAHTWFKNLDKLIKYVNREQLTNSSSRVNVLYSTPSCYLQEVHKTRKSFSVKKDDFFPYSNDPYGFWNGYYTSRPTFKYFVHSANNWLQACKQLAVGAFGGKPSQHIIDQVFELSEPVAIMQHHDAITGTAKQHVTDDYSLRLTKGLNSCDDVMDKAFQRLQPFLDVPLEPTYKFCHLLNISQCGPSEEKTDFKLSVYNPLARDVHNAYIRVPVATPVWTVQSEMGTIPSQTVKIPDHVLKIPGRNSSAKYELIFPVATLKGLELMNFRITENIIFKENSTLAENTSDSSVAVEVETGSVPIVPKASPAPDFVIENSNGLAIVFDTETGLLKSVIKGTVELPVKQNFYYYLGMAGNNSQFNWRASGAYIFRPNTTKSSGLAPEPVANRVKYHVYEGTHVTEVHQVFSDWVSQVIRLYDKTDLVEFEWLVGPIPIDDRYGKEIVTKFTTNLPTKGVFFTDSNGRQLVKRKRDYRESYPLIEYEPVAGNYYPVPSRMMISKDEDLSKNDITLTVLNDRSQGGTSMFDGEIELMLHRRLLYDDAFGVDEALNEVQYGKGLVARGKLWLLLSGEGTGTSNSRHREAAQNIFMDKILGFSDMKLVSPSENGIISDFVLNTYTQHAHLLSRQTIISNLTHVLPPNVHLLTVEPISPSEFLLRLEHYYEMDDDPAYSRPVELSVQAVLQALPIIKSLKETSLGANQWIEDVRRFEWIAKTEEGIHPREGQEEELLKNADKNKIRLYPMKIKTFIVKT